MSHLQSGRRWLFAALGLAIAAITVSHELIASPMLIKSALNDGVDGFACRDLLVETSGGWWNGRDHTMHAALRMPQSCLNDLRRQVESGHGFHAERCNLVEVCWVRVDGDATYTITFHPDYAGFGFERR